MLGSGRVLLAARALGSARLPGGVEPVGEGGVAAACSGGADGLGEGAAGSGQDDEFPGAGDAGVEQVAPQHHPGRGGQRDDHGGVFTVRVCSSRDRPVTAPTVPLKIPALPLS